MAISFRDYAAAIYGCYSTIPDEEREALHAWEAEHVDGSGTYDWSDWPGPKSTLASSSFSLSLRGALPEASTLSSLMLVTAASKEIRQGRLRLQPIQAL